MVPKSAGSHSDGERHPLRGIGTPIFEPCMRIASSIYRGSDAHAWLNRSRCVVLGQRGRRCPERLTDDPEQVPLQPETINLNVFESMAMARMPTETHLHVSPKGNL